MATAKVKGLLFGDWFASRVERAGGAWTARTDLYRDYRRFVGGGRHIGPQAFAQAMEAEGVRATKRGGVWGRLGVRIKATAPDVTIPIGGSTMKVGGDQYKVLGGSVTFSPDMSPRVDDNEGSANLTRATMSMSGEGLKIDTVEAPFWRMASLNPGGPVEYGVAMVCEGAADEASARIAHELFAERQRQKSAEGWDAAHDDEYRNGELQRAAAAYAYGAAVKPGDSNWLRTNVKLPRPPAMYHTLETLRSLWPWSFEWWKPGDPRRMLVKAGALIIAAIEAIDRKRAQEQGRG